MTDEAGPRILREREVEHVTGLGRSARRQLEARGEFPRRIPLPGRRIGWLEEEISAWINKCAAAREEGTNDV